MSLRHVTLGRYGNSGYHSLAWRLVIVHWNIGSFIKKPVPTETYGCIITPSEKAKRKSRWINGQKVECIQIPGGSSTPGAAPHGQFGLLFESENKINNVSVEQVTVGPTKDVGFVRY